MLLKDLVKLYSSLAFLRVGVNGLSTTGLIDCLDEADGEPPGSGFHIKAVEGSFNFSRKPKGHYNSEKVGPDLTQPLLPSALENSSYSSLGQKGHLNQPSLPPPAA